MALKQYVTDEKDYLVSLRRYFHAHPEVSLKEYNTCKKIEEELDKIGLLHKRVGETGVYAWICLLYTSVTELWCNNQRAS